jgi:translocation and assembly module TamB
VVYPVGVLKSFDSALSGSLTVSGAKAPWNVGGSIVVSRARSTREVDIRDEIVEALKRQAGEVDLGPRDPIVNLDLSVQVPGSIVVNNRNIQAVVGGVLQIQGTDQRPIVTGQMEVSRGRFVYRRDFRMTRGLVTFDDPVRPDPRLDINAVSEVGSYRVFVNITGRASNAKVDLSIDPATREDGIPINKMEILVLLSTGTMPDSTRAVGETQMAARTEALNLVVGQFEEPVERLFDMSGQSVVRQVYIDTYSEEGTGTPIARFNVPLNIVDKLDAVMRYDQSGNWRGSIEYALHDSISVSGILDGQSKNELQTNQSKGVGGDTGVDLKFRFSFP